MRRLLYFVCFASLVSAAPSLHAQKGRPQFRPAVLSTGADSLVNRIDAKGLLKKGQKDGAVQFGVTIGPDGTAKDAWTYHAMPGSAALEEELLARLPESKFTPPIYNHQPVTVMLYGTLVFDADAAPYVHLFLNQDPAELKAENDFIGPQPVIGADSGFVGLRPPATLPVDVIGVVELRIQVSDKGILEDLSVTGEDPPLLGFRDSAVTDFKDAKFIPAFRSGDAIESTSSIALCYRPTFQEPEQ